MGKFKNIKKVGKKPEKPVPLSNQIEKDEYAQHSGRTKQRARRDSHDEFVDGNLAQNILKQSIAQLQEVATDNDEEWPTLETTAKRKFKNRLLVDSQPVERGIKKRFCKEKARSIGEDSDEEDDTVEKVVPSNVGKIVDDFESELCVDPEDLDIIEHFKKAETNPQKRLADLFKEQLTEIQTEIQTEVDAQSNLGLTLSEEVQTMCKEIGQILSHYRSGPLPKMFKAFPTMACWEELVYLTNPDKWTAAAMFQATRYFVSSLRAAMAQRFVCLVLLPRIRDDISFYKRLNYHLYQALIKVLFKPAAFFKGILFPLCQAGNCTLREAIIIGSVIAKNHIPLEHSGAAIKTIAALAYSGPSSIFLRVLLDKKYALPYQVIDEVYDHFMRFQFDRRLLPVLWHQSLLAFAQRYKNDLSHDQIQNLLKLLRIHFHYKITPEVERELQSSTYRHSDEPMITE